MSFEPVYYFINYKSRDHEPGYILMSPYTGCPSPEGYREEYADNLPAVRRLEKILQRQEQVKCQSEWEKNESLIGPGQQAVRDRMYARMISGRTSPYERDYIKAWFQLKDEKKKEKYEAIYEQQQAYLHALHFDTPKGRAVDKEEVSLDRLNVQMDS